MFLIALTNNLKKSPVRSGKSQKTSGGLKLIKREKYLKVSLVHSIKRIDNEIQVQNNLWILQLIYKNGDII